MNLSVKKILLSFSFFSVLAFVLAHQSFHMNSSKKEFWPDKRTLMRQIWRTRKVLLVYPALKSELAKKYFDYAMKFQKDSWREVYIKADTAVSPKELTSQPLILLGTPESNRILKQIKDKLPVHFSRTGFEIASYSFKQPSDVMDLSIYPNPLNKSWPLTVITGNTDQAILHTFRDRKIGWRFIGDFQVFRQGKSVLIGFFTQKDKAPWGIDESNLIDLLKENRVVYVTPHYKYFYHGNPVPLDSIKLLSERQEVRLQKLFSRLKIQPATWQGKISYHLYQSAEKKGLITGNTDVSHFSVSAKEVHVLFNDVLRGDDFFADAKLIILSTLGASPSQALTDGLAMSFTSEWGKHDYRYWAKIFYQTGNLLSLEKILNNKIYQKESYLFMRPLAGSLVDFLIQHLGWQKFLKLYRSPEDNSELDKAWLRYLGNLSVPGTLTNDTDHTVFTPVFQKGFCYAHEGYQIYNGYLSQRSFESLKKLRSLGVDWISITPFGYLENRNKPGYLIYSFGAGAENDESLVTAAHMAKQLGMKVMLKPHVLMPGGHWGWPGEIKMMNENDWQKFFDYYYRWIRHYALLAEMYDFDMFCIGVELVNATVGHEKSWRQMIARIRQIYHGPLVYAANWGEEFEHLPFWDALDYMGLNCYYPLTDTEKANLSTLIQGARSVVNRIEKVVQKYHKPLILTEVGFTSTRKSWRQPHDRNRQEPPYMDDQAQAYEALFQAFWSKPWFYGFYWWKWPTELAHGGSHHNGFTPNGKPAEKVVKKWYSKNRQALNSWSN